MKAAISSVCLAAGIFAAAGLAVPLSGMAAHAEEAGAHERMVAMAVTDVSGGDWFKAQSENAKRVEEAIKRQKEEREAAAAAEAARIAEEQAAQEVYYEPYYDGGYSDGGSGGRGGGYSGGDGFMQQGVRAGVNGMTETWYSSSASYHYRTGEWTADDEGYYRDSEGRYVVAVSEDQWNAAENRNYQRGDTIETSKGAGIVMDDGCDVGVVDMYVDF